MSNKKNNSLQPDQYPMGFIPFPEKALDDTLADRFEDMVRQFPTNIAVTDRGKSITYSELNTSANRLAWEILSIRGEGVEVISFFAGYELEAAVVTWGILKAGKTYLILNPDHPVDKQLDLLKEAGVKAIVSFPKYQAPCEALQKSLPGIALIHLDRVKQKNEDNPVLQADPKVIPYINFTSGTTGKPKLLIHENRGLLEQQQAKVNELGLVSNDRWAQLNPLSFGGGGFSFYGAMNVGARICLYDIVNTGLQDFPDWLRAEGITIINMPPPVFRNIFGNMPDGEKFPSVRIILLGGDTMIGRDIEIFQKHFPPSCHLLNYLGLTEVGIATRYFVNPQVDIGAIVPVGYPFKGVQVSIIGENGAPLPPGGEGELVIKTSYLTRDPRLNQENLQDNRFTIDPQTGWCTVLSGDLGRIREDGALEHLGRKDTVIKIRGLRIDTAEVEAMLYTHEMVLDAAVTARGSDSIDELQIVAYVVPKVESNLTIAQLYGYLSWKLPQYMIPSRFVFLEKLPLSSNGKIDRNQLPEPDENLPVLGEKFISPRNSVEWQLAGIWSDLLKVKRIGINDNFFTLGGHSLLALQLLEQVEKDMKVKLPMQTLAKHPTLAGMAGLIAEQSPTTVRTSITLLRKGENRPALFFVPGGARSGISVMNFATRLNPAQTVYALEYPGMDGYLEPIDDIRSLAQFFIQQVLSIQPEGPYHLAGPCLGGVIVFEMAQQLISSGKEVGQLFLLDSTPPGGESTWAAKKRAGHYYSNRTARILKTVKVSTILGSLKSRLRRNRVFLTMDMFWKHLRYNFHKTDEQLWQDRRLDKQSWLVFDKLQVARKSYLPSKYSGNAIVIFNSVSEGTSREDQWKELLDRCDLYYIPGTNHGNIFVADASLDRIAYIINKHINLIQ